MQSPYRSLAYTAGIHFFIMYALTYAAANALDDVLLNVNRLYMAAIMVAPMVILMLLCMGHMFENKRLNIALYTASVFVFLLGFASIRLQTFVGNAQFLRSMIPHHSSAIVMCQRSDITDPEITTLCRSIVDSQQREIDQMNEILNRLN